MNVQEEVRHKQISYWKEELAGAPTRLELPTDKLRPAVQSFRGARETFELPQELLKQLKYIGHQEQATLFMTLGAGFMALLHRYTGQGDILVGTPILGRTLSETASPLNRFHNTVVLRSRFTEHLNFRSLLQQVRERTLGAHAHPDLPFEQLVAELAPERDPSHAPVFQVMFVLDNAEGVSQVSKGNGNRSLETGTSEYDLTLAISETENGLKGWIEYSTDLFEAHTIRRLCGHYGTLLEAIARDPDQIIAKLPMLTDAERQQVLVDWNNTPAVYPGQDLCLHELIEAQAGRTPDQAALVFEQQSLTYRELNRRANQLAHHLRGLGVGPDMLVGLFVERSLEMIVGLLGILKAGAAYMPMDTAFPQERIAFMLTDANVTVLLTQTSLLASLPTGARQAVCLDSFDWTHSERPAHSDARARPENLAYVIYTSGSTGRPKGVCIEHRNIVNYVLGVGERLQLKPGMNHATVSTIAADLGNTVIFPALITGGCLHIISQGRAENQRMLSDYFNRENIDILKIVPSHLAALQTGNNPEQAMPRSRLILGGEASRLDWIERLRLLSPNCEIYNHYGPTETTVGVLTYHVGAQLPSTLSGTLPLGSPLPSSRVYILDEHRQPVPVGVPGELCIGGHGVARGYLNRPDLTAEKFIPDPFGPDPGGRLYRTGDRARYLPDGNIEFCGRIDHQIKIRGYRVELGEIEGALREHRGVRDAVVSAYEDEPGNKQLVGYVVPREGESPTAEDLRHFLRQKLPKYMAPDHFVFLDSIPLTPNGKIDRKALPAPSYENISTAKKFVAPGTETEKALAAIWTGLLKVERIGIHDDFFELGGHSLMAIKAVSQIRDIFGVDLPLATLLEAPTIADLAGILHKEHWEPSWSSLVPMRSSGSKPPVFLVHAHGGNVLEYHSLVNRLDHDQPVYAFQARGLDGHIEKNTSLERMASAFIDELRRFQSEGPYFLGGFCLGGLLALEMAQQLTAAGQEVALVVLIQSMHPEARRFKPETTVFHRWWYRATARISRELENVSHRGKDYIAERCRQAWDLARARTAIAFDNLTGKDPKDLSRLPKLYIFEALGMEHKKAMNKYVPRPYGGDVVLFRASKQISGLMADEYLGWRRVLHGNLDVCEAPGYQQTLLLEPNVSRLAQEFGSRLKAAQERNCEEAREGTTHRNAPGAMFPL